MIKALLGGSIVEILLGLYVVVPVALGALFSAIGLALETIAKPSSGEADAE
jgi:hypothetical protein